MSSLALAISGTSVYCSFKYENNCCSLNENRSAATALLADNNLELFLYCDIMIQFSFSLLYDWR